MRSVTLFLILITQVLASSITIAPLDYFAESTLLFGKQTVEYSLTSTSPVSVLLMNSEQYLSEEWLNYDQICSRIEVTSINVSCVYFTHVKFQISSVPIYFLIENLLDGPVNVTYTLSYTYGFQYEPWNLFFGSVILTLVMVLSLCALREKFKRADQ